MGVFLMKYTKPPYELLNTERLKKSVRIKLETLCRLYEQRDFEKGIRFGVKPIYDGLRLPHKTRIHKHKVKLNKGE